MSEINSSNGLSNNQSRTDWNWLAQDADDEIDYSEIPPLSESFFRKAQTRLPHAKTTITIDVDADVLAWFKAQQGECEHRINAALRIYAEAHVPLNR